MPSMSGKATHQVITGEEEDDQICANRCSPIGVNNKDTVTMQRRACSPRRLKNLALSDMLSEFQDEGISSPPADLAATFNSTEEPPILYTGECMEMNNDILDLTKPLTWDSTCGLKKGNSSISLDSLNDNYIESQDGTVDSEKVETNDDGEECSCGENISPACPVHREKALLTEEIQRTCSDLVESLKFETPDDNDVEHSSTSSKKKKQKSRKRDALEDLYSSLESRDFEAYLKSRTSLRTLNMLSSCDQDSCTSTESSSSRLYRRYSQDTDRDDSSRPSSTNSSNFSIPSVHKSDLSSSPESYDLLYKSFEAAVMIEKDEEGGGESEADENDAPSLTPLEMFNQASPKLQKALSERQQRVLEGVHSDNEQNEAMESSGMYDSRLCKSLPSNQSNCEAVDYSEGQKVTTFAQLAKTRKKADVIQAPQTLTIKPTHWSELVANQEKKNIEKSESIDASTPDANTPKRPHSLPIQLRFITKPASRPTQTPDQSQPGVGSLIRGVTRTISAPEGFGADGLPIESQQPEMTRTTLEKLNALEAPISTPPARYAPPFDEFIASTDNYQSLPPHLERYRHWLNNSDGQSQSSKDSNQPFRERISSESAADMHKVYSGNQSYMQERPHSLVLASYCDDGMEALPPQEIPVSPRFVGHHDTVDMLRKRALVAAIDGAVDHILGHFAQAINKSPLEKVRLGDSQQTPNVGHIVLHYLCPAISDLLVDGLKPHMQSFIVGRVKTTVWTPVEATTRLGPGTRSLYELICTLTKLRYLKEPSMKTNAFIFGLLNTRNVEIWLEHIRSHPDIIRTLYEPEAFLSLCNTSTRQLFDKLLLALQPLAILPFNLDYQFEHKYMQQHASILREKQQLQEQHTGSMHRQGSLQDQRQSPEGGRASGRFSSLLGRGSRKDLNRSNSWASSLSSSFGFGKTFAGQSSGRGQTQSSEQSESDRLLRIANTSPSKDITEDKVGGSAETTPTNSTQSWSLDWIKSFVAAGDQSQDSKIVDSTTTTQKVVTPPAQQSPNTSSSWSRFGASMFKSFNRMRQTEPQQEQQENTAKQPELVQIEERPSNPPGSPCKPKATDAWNKASPGSPMKALCHHVTMSPGELSFSKGDILMVDHQVDPDWLLCHHGHESGLVHIDYVQGFQ